MNDIHIKRKELRESPLGNHFTETFNCWRRGYLRYICGLRPVQTEEYFAYGNVIHEAMEFFYNNPEMSSRVHDVLEVVMEFYKDKFPSGSFDSYFRKAVGSMSDWITKYLSYDLSEFDLVGTEVEITAYLPNGYPKTFRIDRLMRSKKVGKLVAFDTKTTGHSVMTPIKAMNNSEQALSYLWAIRQEFKERPLGFYVDALYARPLKDGTFSIATARSDLITFPDDAMDQYILGQVGLMSEIIQKVKAMKHYPVDILFYRCPGECQTFSCPFEAICRKKVAVGDLPEGFTLDPWQAMVPITSLTISAEEGRALQEELKDRQLQLSFLFDEKKEGK